MSRNSLIGLLGVTLMTVSACGGRDPNPVSRYEIGDEDRACEGLKVEIADNEQEMLKLLPYEDATGKNVALGVTGYFLIVPLFFMDFKDAEAIEIRALRKRNQWLRELAHRKGCTVPPPKIQWQEESDEEQQAGDGANAG